MGYETPVVDPNTGECCDCASQSNCQCGPPPCVTTCQSRPATNGLAQFCGFAEYVNPSNPPVYYRTKTLYGSIFIGNFGPGCYTPGACGYCSVAWSGANKYDKNTCAYTQGGTITGGGGCQNPFSSPTNDVLISFLGCAGCGTSGVDSYTRTTHSIAPNFNCTPNFSGFWACQVIQYNQAIEAVLGDEDTYDDAIERAVVNVPWAGKNCDQNFSVTTIPRPGQNVFYFKQAQFMVSFAGGIAGHTYQFIVTLQERAVGTDTPLVPYAIVTIEAQALPGQTAINTGWQPIPNVPGLEIYARLCRVVDITP